MILCLPKGLLVVVLIAVRVALASDDPEASTFIDTQFIPIVPLLLSDGVPNNDTNRHDHGDDGSHLAQLTWRQLEAADATLELVISQTSAHSALDLKVVYELTEPSAAPLLAAITRPCPRQGQVDRTVELLQEIREALNGLLGPAGVSQLRHALDGRPTSPRGARAGLSGAAGEGGPRHSFPLLRRAVTARLVQVWLRQREGWSRSRSRSQRGWTAEVADLVREVLLQLFLLHRSGMVAREVLEFLHISKAAGTSMCHLAGASGCRALDFGMGRTCLLREFDDQPRWLNGTHHWTAIAPAAAAHTAHPNAFLLYGLPRSPYKKRTCSERLRWMRKMRLNFFANEYTVYNDLLLQNKTLLPPLGLRPPAAPPEDPLVALRRATATFADFVQALSAAGSEGGPAPSSSGRPSSARSGSGPSSRPVGRGSDPAPGYSAVVRGTHLCPRFANVAVLRDPSRRFLSHMAFIAQTYASHFAWPDVSEAFAPGRSSAAWWRAFAPPLMDSYLLRTLAGEGTFALPLGAAGRGPYLQLARAVLAQYDVVLVLELDPGIQQRTCNYGLGWNHSLSEFQLRNASQFSAHTSPRAKLHTTAEAAAQERERVRQLLPHEDVLQELMADAVKYDYQLYRFGAVLAGLDDLVWRVAEGVLGEPMQGQWTDLRGPLPGGVPQCGYINGGMGPAPRASS